MLDTLATLAVMTPEADPEFVTEVTLPYLRLARSTTTRLLCFEKKLFVQNKVLMPSTLVNSFLLIFTPGRAATHCIQ